MFADLIIGRRVYVYEKGIKTVEINKTREVWFELRNTFIISSAERLEFIYILADRQLSS